MSIIVPPIEREQVPPTPYYSDATVALHHGDCLDVLRELPDNSVDAVVCDPPYGLEFMGKAWDSFGRDTGNHAHREKPRFTSDHMGKGFDKIPNTYEAGRPFQNWCQLWATECLRVLKPGGHMLAFGGTRTWHRLACAVEDAGFEVRDSLAWLYGSGFPKSMNVAKAITGTQLGHGGNSGAIRRVTRRSDTGMADLDLDLDLTPDAERWQGWGTALKPAFEPIVMARKPLTGTVAANVLAHGTGALNIDGCRIGDGLDRTPGGATGQRVNPDEGYMGGWAASADGLDRAAGGRWPANVILDESQAAELDAQSGTPQSGKQLPTHQRSKQRMGASGIYGTSAPPQDDPLTETYGDSGGASRFFYVAKADQSERVKVDGIAHPTVKPLDIMRWLVRLVTPPGGTVLEPFAGSGTTVEACILEGFHCIAIEREADYLPLIVQRIHRRRDPVAAVKATGDDGGLFDLLGEATA